MANLKSLSKQTAPKSVMPERIIQFGEGNFLRAFVDWIIWNMDAKTNFNGSVVVVQPIERGMVDWLNGQDCLYHVNLQGRLNGEAVNSLERIDVISRALNPYSQNWAFMSLAEQPEIRFVISNTTEAGIAFDDTCKFTDAPAACAAALSSFQDLQRRSYKGSYHHALRAHLPQRSPPEGLHREVHRAVEG